MILVDSIPKSGTYLVALLLSSLGLENSGLHLRNDRYWNFKDKPLEEIISDPDKFMQPASLGFSLGLVGRDAFAVAHLHFAETARAALASLGATHIFLVRDLRDSLISHMRFISDRRRRVPQRRLLEQTNDTQRMLLYMTSFAERFLKDAQMQIDWLNSSVDCIIRFECLLGDDGEDAQSALLQDIIRSLSLNLDVAQVRETLNRYVIGHSTRTFSGNRSSTKKFWSQGAEEEFRRLGGLQMNCKLGYA